MWTVFCCAGMSSSGEPATLGGFCSWNFVWKNVFHCVSLCFWNSILYQRKLHHSKNRLSGALISGVTSVTLWSGSWIWDKILKVKIIFLICSMHLSVLFQDWMSHFWSAWIIMFSYFNDTGFCDSGFPEDIINCLNNLVYLWDTEQHLLWKWVEYVDT